MWNKRLQVLLEAPTLLPEEAQIRKDRLNALAQEFVDSQAPVVVALVRETLLQLPAAQRTVKPVQLGGLAGGLKFEKDGVIFKFAFDSAGLYGGDAFSAKAASHELKGLNALLGSGVIGLYFPLQAVFDYLGFRVVASCRLPLDARTLKCVRGRRGAAVVEPVVLTPQPPGTALMTAGEQCRAIRASTTCSQRWPAG